MLEEGFSSNVNNTGKSNSTSATTKGIKVGSDFGFVIRTGINPVEIRLLSDGSNRVSVSGSYDSPISP